MRKIAILGGGVGAMVTAVELTNDPNWKQQYEVTVYQMGWRIGGKGASGRNPDYSQRIEEHGLHIWMGFYENAFRMIRAVYDELHQKGLAPDSPFQSWTDAFNPTSFTPLLEYVNGQWKQWPILFPTNDLLPGEGSALDEPLPTVWESFGMILESVVERVEETLGIDPLDTHSRRLHWLVDTITSGSESVVCLIPGRHSLLLALIDSIQEVLELMLGSPVAQAVEAADDDLRRLAMILDTALAALRGMAADDVICGGFEQINQYDFVEWLGRNGAHHPLNPITLGMYDACFAYVKGAAQGVNMEAGTFLRAALRLIFTYKGAIFWRMMAGMGDTIFSPIYKVLEARGVTFKFFHKVTGLHLSADRQRIASIDIDVQATVKGGGEYNPLVTVLDLPCWPSVPDYDQLVEGNQLKGTPGHPFANNYFQNTNLESWWTDFPPAGKKTLAAGTDFDDVVLGISLGALPFLCGELAAADPKWAAMLQNVRTVRTQALQLWMNKTAADMGWKAESGFLCPPNVTEKPVLTGFVEPFDTWADMSHLIPREAFPAGEVQQIAYFCNAAPDDPAMPGFNDAGYPDRVLQQEAATAANFLSQSGAAIWPKGRDPHDPGQFDSSVLVDGMDAQFVRVNIDPNELYVQSLAGTGQFRLPPDQSGFDNLVLAGDWTENELNVGCVEAAVTSGMMASRKLCGRPERFFGAGGGRLPIGGGE
ncbi:MAG TPA: NAD(P)-binding protein [Bryobacteraceae bacterium]|nr:NAD(P)-binding protein [Bryobacteraceae bacterium]